MGHGGSNNGKGGTKECRRRFDSKEEAYERAAKVTAVFKKIEAGVVDMQSGIRIPIDVAAARYREWLLSKGRTRVYSSGRGGSQIHQGPFGVEYCNQISYEVMGRLADHFKIYTTMDADVQFHSRHSSNEQRNCSMRPLIRLHSSMDARR